MTHPFLRIMTQVILGIMTQRRAVFLTIMTHPLGDLLTIMTQR
jgi:hypothetical protein